MQSGLIFASLVYTASAAGLYNSQWGLSQPQMEAFMGYLTKFGKNYKTLDEFEIRAQRF